jgi:hypothetical protein
MTGAQSRFLKVGDRLKWNDSLTDFAVINQSVDPSFDYKKIRWTADPTSYGAGGEIVGN